MEHKRNVRDAMFILLLYLEEAATEMIFMEIISCYDSHHAITSFSFIFSLLWALCSRSVCFREGVSLRVG